MDWVPILLAAWVLSSALIAVVIGRALYLAEHGGTDARAAPVVDIRTTLVPRFRPPRPGEEASPAGDLVRTLALVDQRTRGPHGKAQHRGARPPRRGG